MKALDLYTPYLLTKTTILVASVTQGGTCHRRKQCAEGGTLRVLTGRIGWSQNVYNEELFRVFEYGAMWVVVLPTCDAH